MVSIAWIWWPGEWLRSCDGMHGIQWGIVFLGRILGQSRVERDGQGCSWEAIPLAALIGSKSEHQEWTPAAVVVGSGYWDCGAGWHNNRNRTTSTAANLNLRHVRNNSQTGNSAQRQPKPASPAASPERQSASITRQRPAIRACSPCLSSALQYYATAYYAHWSRCGKYEIWNRSETATRVEFVLHLLDTDCLSLFGSCAPLLLFCHLTAFLLAYVSLWFISHKSDRGTCT